MPLNQLSSDAIRTRIVEYLAPGHFCSGEVLGEQLGISRAAVSNHIKCLHDLGLDIYSVQGKGYKLAQPLILLNKSTIAAQLSNPGNANLIVLNVIDSTNQYIKEHQTELPNGFVCLAEAQTAGRGRHGRKWVSPYGASMYLSMHWTFALGYQALNGLSLVIGVAVVEALKKLGIVEAQVKWPNDIYVQGKKLAGILIEVEGQMGATCQCVIGIGLNVALPTSVTQIDQPYTDMQSILEQDIDRNRFAATLINELHTTMEVFEKSGLQPFIAPWQAADVYANKAIKLIIGQKTIEGIGRGIDNSGALLIETAEGVRAYQGGEISVRPG
ncbi:biotin--[acetyl-CoA-carboxylase] synthetase [Paraglaciecola hydrolytica]|uniref:Bifunctional ligase/repressor BirA n=1 Tax=Paraglaciecola hydrolytica TaxID=1799789 RepID=A0A148KMN5_9ALTE|nr:biotin--[acetyl-CoA-carboxylase] synthetase [Paraglaciecola hydrolytica]